MIKNMKKFLKYIALAAIASALMACEEKPLDPNSQIFDSVQEENAFDKWLITNYIEPYNIMLKYRMEMNESDLNYWLVPAEYDKSIQIAKLMKFLCFEPYDEITGSKEFIRTYYPKMIHLIGSGAYRNNGTFAQALAVIWYCAVVTFLSIYAPRGMCVSRAAARSAISTASISIENSSTGFPSAKAESTVSSRNRSSRESSSEPITTASKGAPSV